MDLINHIETINSILWGENTIKINDVHLQREAKCYSNHELGIAMVYYPFKFKNHSKISPTRPEPEVKKYTAQNIIETIERLNVEEMQRRYTRSWSKFKREWNIPYVISKYLDIK